MSRARRMRSLALHWVRAPAASVAALACLVAARGEGRDRLPLLCGRQTPATLIRAPSPRRGLEPEVHLPLPSAAADGAVRRVRRRGVFFQICAAGNRLKLARNDANSLVRIATRCSQTSCESCTDPSGKRSASGVIARRCLCQPALTSAGTSTTLRTTMGHCALGAGTKTGASAFKVWVPVPQDGGSRLSERHLRGYPARLAPQAEARRPPSLQCLPTSPIAMDSMAPAWRRSWHFRRSSHAKSS
eukprot:CAMPEP_0176090066 /NCGR_PEP_ID=MMETSP0120_2-20121206/45108_1 /TAXON_ID=160619 /ORGANISM="Kryptoperidinium foliaceum, Strain CCMP 1326" /LENGTH=244 /DNA_ID=CAMNT_0017423949 /DNA_START=200 /DNA_END=933 /DNA_ORIENTATION=-